MEALESKAAPATRKSKPSRIPWFGIVLIVSGVALAAVFFVRAFLAEGNSTPNQLSGIVCLVLALAGVILVTHSRRTPQERAGESDPALNEPVSLSDR